MSSEDPKCIHLHTFSKPGRSGHSYELYSTILTARGMRSLHNKSRDQKVGGPLFHVELLKLRDICVQNAHLN